MTEETNIYKFFNEQIGNGFARKELLNISKIEKLAGIPNRKLYMFLNNKKYANINGYVDNLVPVLVNVGYRPLNVDNIFI